MGRRWFASIPLLAAWMLAARVQGATITTQLERETIMAGESTSLLISVEGGTPESAESFPAFPGLSIRYTGNSQSFTSINGRSSFKHVLNFAVSASQPGQYRIPSIKIMVDGAAHQSQPVTLTVTKADPASAQNRYAFLRLNASKQEVYVGEIFPVEVQLYVTDAENIQAPQLKSDGFVLHKQVDHTRSQSQVGNIIYNVLSFRMSVSAVKAGLLNLGPAEMNLTLRLRPQRDPGDIFGFFPTYQRKPVALSSPVAALNVLPLPATNAPPEFSGAIGAFTWTVSASPKEVSAGDPITLRVVVSGRGNLDNLKMPPFDWPGFKVYQPASTVSTHDALGLEGIKTFEQVVIPLSDSIQEIPALTLAYFDPARKSYVKLTEPAQPIRVKPASPQAQPSVLAGASAESDQPPEKTDIVHIKTDPGPLATLAPPLVERPLFFLLQGIPLAGFLSAWIWRKRQDKLVGNPKLRRKIEAARIIRAGLVELRKSAQVREKEAFYALLFRLLQEQLGERLGLPAGAITEAVLDEHLPGRGAPPEVIQRLRALFQVCNQARYAPAQSDQELLALAAELETALDSLRRLPD